MKCLICNTANDDNANFCHWCGEEFPEHALRELRQQLNALRDSMKIDENSRLTREIANKNIEIANLKAQLPQNYKVISSQADCYYYLAGSYINTGSYFNQNVILLVYTVLNGYALTVCDWVKMTDLVKC